MSPSAKKDKEALLDVVWSLLKEGYVINRERVKVGRYCVNIVTIVVVGVLSVDKIIICISITIWTCYLFSLDVL